jgi:hypothetical protein
MDKYLCFAGTPHTAHFWVIFFDICHFTNFLFELTRISIQSFIISSASTFGLNLFQVDLTTEYKMDLILQYLHTVHYSSKRLTQLWRRNDKLCKISYFLRYVTLAIEIIVINMRGRRSADTVFTTIYLLYYETILNGRMAFKISAFPRN